MISDDEFRRNMSVGLPIGRNKMRPLSDFVTKTVDQRQLKRQAEVSEMIKQWIRLNAGVLKP